MSAPRLSGLEKEHCVKITKKLYDHPLGAIFRNEDVLKKTPNYYSVISEPMTLQTVLDKLESDSYRNLGEWKSDLTKIWTNSKTFNSGNTGITAVIEIMEKKAEKYAKMVPKTEIDLWYYELKSSFSSFERELDFIVRGRKTR